MEQTPTNVPTALVAPEHGMKLTSLVNPGQDWSPTSPTTERYMVDLTARLEEMKAERNADLAKDPDHNTDSEEPSPTP